MAKKKKSTVRPARLLGVAALVLLVGGIGFVGWRWQAEMTCTRIDVTGVRHAAPAELTALAHVDTGMVLFDIDPALVEDRVMRHPWVQSAEVTRLPTGTLTIKVQERVPVLLALNEHGVPAQYLDRFGYPMPVLPEAAYDVPLLRGLSQPYHPMRPVEDAAMLDLLGALAGATADVDALVSELELRDGEVWLYTAPLGEQGAVPVRLGRQGGFAARLERLHAFWHQAMLTRADRTYDVVDLRFDSQIVTREHPL